MVGMVVVFATLGTFTRVAFAAAVAGAAGAFGSFAVVAVEMIVVRHGVCFVLIIVVGGGAHSAVRAAAMVVLFDVVPIYPEIASDTNTSSRKVKIYLIIVHAPFPPCPPLL
jgi:hypothetical protein